MEIGSEQNEGNYTQYDLMTSTGSVQGDRLKGQIAFTMQHRMALAVVKMPNLTYSFTNGGIDDYFVTINSRFVYSEQYSSNSLLSGKYGYIPFLVNPEEGILN